MPMNEQQAREYLGGLSNKYGASVEQGDIDRLQQTNDDDLGRLQSAYEAQYQRRGASGQTGSGTDSAELTKQGYGSGRDETADDAFGQTQQRDVQSSNSGNSGSNDPFLGNQGGNSNQGPPEWYRQEIERQRAAETERKAKGDALYGTLMDRAKQSLAVDRTDPGIRSQADAFSAQQMRGMRNQMSDLAESAGPYAQGQLRNEQRMANERYGATTGAFEAELMNREVAARRNEISDALGQMGGMLSADQQMGIQRELGLLDSGLRDRGLDIQRQLGFGDLGLRGRQIDNQNNQFYSNQRTMNDQFLAQLGLNAEDRGRYWDAIYSGILG